MGFINQQETCDLNSLHEYTSQIYVSVSSFSTSCCLEYITGGNKKRGRNMMDRALVAFRSRDLVDKCNLGNVKYCFVLWSSSEEREGLNWTDVDFWKSFFDIHSCAARQI